MHTVLNDHPRDEVQVGGTVSLPRPDSGQVGAQRQLDLGESVAQVGGLWVLSGDGVLAHAKLERSWAAILKETS